MHSDGKAIAMTSGAFGTIGAEGDEDDDEEMEDEEVRREEEEAAAEKRERAAGRKEAKAGAKAEAAESVEMQSLKSTLGGGGPLHLAMQKSEL